MGSSKLLQLPSGTGSLRRTTSAVKCNDITSSDGAIMKGLKKTSRNFVETPKEMKAF